MTYRTHSALCLAVSLAALAGHPAGVRAQVPPLRNQGATHLLRAGLADAARKAEDPVLAPVLAEEPPKMPASPFVKQPSLLIPAAQPAGTLSAAQKAVQEAERHFQYGKFFAQDGKAEEARKEFDAAIDVLLDLEEDTPGRAAAEAKFEELIRLIHRYDIETLGSGQSPESPVFVQSPLPEILDLTFPIDPRLKDRVLAQVAATSSQLPLTVNDAVLSYINFFASPRGQKVLLSGLKKSGKYRQMISRILDEEGVPQELIHLAQAESGFSPRAVSWASAVGMWQFVRQRGAEYGLSANRVVDERLDPEKATRAAARHLRDLYNQLGDWHLAMAAYNCGPYCIERAVQRTGYADFWELRNRGVLPRETMNYVPAILAMAIVSKNLAAYGLEALEAEAALEYDTIRVTAPTSLALVADAIDLPVAELREYNPSLLRSQAPAGYEVRVPRTRGNAVIGALESVPEDKRTAWRLHRVGGGETVAAIARRYSVTPNAIIAANAKLDASFFESPERGEMLLIPTPAVPDTPARAAQSRNRAAPARRTVAQSAPRKAATTSTHVATASPRAQKTVNR